MPQTREIIAYAQKTKVQIIAFINKIDKPNILFDKILNPLANNSLISEK